MADATGTISNGDFRPPNSGSDQLPAGIPNSGTGFPDVRSILTQVHDQQAENGGTTVRGTLVNIEHGHIVSGPSTSARINYANEARVTDQSRSEYISQVPPSSRLPEMNSSSVSVQQQLLWQNQLMLNLMTKMSDNRANGDASANSRPRPEIPATVTSVSSPPTSAPGPANDSLNFDSLFDNVNNETQDSHSHTGYDDDFEEGECSDGDEYDEFDSTEALSEMEHFYSQDNKCSPKVDARLSKLVNAGIKANLDKDRKKELLSKHLRPENCEDLIVPRVNKSIWNNLDRFQRDRDLQTQVTQTQLCKAMFPLTHLTDALLKGNKGMGPSQVKECVSLANDTFRIMQVAFSDLSHRRRMALKPALDKEFQPLCSADNPVTQLLFGDNLENQIKELSDGRKISKTLAKSSSHGNRYSPYQSKGQRGGRGGTHGHQSHYNQHRGYDKSYTGSGYRSNNGTNRGRGSTNKTRKGSFLGGNHRNNTKKE